MEIAKTKQNSIRKSISNFRRASSAGMRSHLGARIVNRGKHGHIKGSWCNLWEEVKQTLPEETGTWREAGNKEEWVLGKKWEHPQHRRHQKRQGYGFFLMHYEDS